MKRVAKMEISDTEHLICGKRAAESLAEDRKAKARERERERERERRKDNTKEPDG